MTAPVATDPAAPFDVVVIGSGPGGYVAAIRAAQLGLRVACVEKAELGGICLNWGCIPTKALLRTAEVLELFHRAGEFGLKAGAVEVDFPAVIKRSRDVAAKISKGVAFLLKKNAIEHVGGTARLLPRPGAWRPHQVHVDLVGGGTRVLSARHVILATGARARPLPGVAFDGERIVDYRKAMTLPQQPRSLVVIGSGAIGVEFASFYRALGTEVTIVEYLPRLVPNEDAEVSAELARAFERRGIALRLAHKVTAATNRGDHATVAIEPVEAGKGAASELRADVVLCAAGIAANTEGLGLEHHDVRLERGFIAVDGQLRCGDGLWAIGDVAGRGLAHTASAEGVWVAEQIAGVTTVAVDYGTIPACTYCHPEVASVGLTEAKATERQIPVKVGKFPWRPLGKAVAAGEATGFVKVLWHAETGALVGAHLIGPAVTDLIAELTLAKATEVNAESLVYTIHAHPTFAEAIKEASEAALGHAIHL
ncbi:MAG: dihydrolipoyl dehydrogenase [Kofleriaceae bacterium]|nr:dihydrolipoyl dehydrogenase [Kofleriaceae bacterium]MBP9171588.1 dihydrolipoyl dehydrogenase [Kofleriaceae bacterium]MBP9861585.1 dihydrolipoyl dehydrogenase [Kofleriaceae bacterium]